MRYPVVGILQNISISELTDLHVGVGDLRWRFPFYRSPVGLKSLLSNGHQKNFLYKFVLMKVSLQNENELL